MDPARKRKIRLVVALGVAIALATALIYTSFSASTEASKPSQLQEGRSYEVTGKVVKRLDPPLRATSCASACATATGTASVPVRYTGAVPDPFREGREVIVKGELENGTFVAQRDSLVTKCPSKFTKKKNS